VGPSGGGKSTVASLLLRFERPSRGRLWVDGVDRGRVHADSLRAQFALVTQEPLLFSATVRENIALGRPGAGFDEVVAAARIAQADGFVRALPAQYGGPIGERGVVPRSGGQRAADRPGARRALARARAGPRRADQQPGPQSEQEVEGRARGRARGPDGAGRRAPALDDPGCGPHLRARGRAARRGGHARPPCWRGAAAYARLWVLAERPEEDAA